MLKNNNNPNGTLNIVSLPIGNLKDITLRALETLNMSDIIYCEDTRVTMKLTNHYDIDTKLKSYHEHSTAKAREKIIEELKAGNNIALVSDAGTPLISDPGYKLIKEVQKKGYRISSSPGVSAPIMALSISGMPTDKFFFIGFLPTKTNAKKEHLLEIKNIKVTIILFESAKRVKKTLACLLECFGNRKISICRELTKKFEEVVTGSIEDIIKNFSERESIKGEIVIVVEGANDLDNTTGDIELMLSNALLSMSVSEAAKEVSKFTNLSRKEVYNMALTMMRKIKK